jgi:hypothetical protein
MMMMMMRMMMMMMMLMMMMMSTTTTLEILEVALIFPLTGTRDLTVFGVWYFQVQYQISICLFRSTLSFNRRWVSNNKITRIEVGALQGLSSLSSLFVLYFCLLGSNLWFFLANQARYFSPVPIITSLSLPIKDK